ncbi:MAG: hypothetical protein VW779_07690, partial [Halieaceae bacterium]
GRPVGVIVDDKEAERTGPWRESNKRSNRIGDHYLATAKDKGPHSVTWKAVLPKTGTYEVRVSFCGGTGLTKTAPYVIRHAKGETRLIIDQGVNPPIDNLWFPLG